MAQTGHKTVAISGRITQEDYEYLMSRPIAGMVTASEKLRHVAHFYRRYHEGLEQYGECLREMNLLMEPARMSRKEVENSERMHSELIERLESVIPDLMARLVTSAADGGKKDARVKLMETEERLLQPLLGLVESILRMSLTRRTPTYRPDLFAGRLEALYELLELSKQTQQKTKEDA